MSSGGKASVRPLELPLDTPGDEAIAGTRGEDAPVEEKNLLERMLEAQNLRRALHQVRRTPGCPRSRRDDRGRPGSVPEDTLADDPSRLTGGHLCPPARPADGNPKAGGRDPQPGYPDRARPVHRARPPAGPAGGMGPDVLREERRLSPTAQCPPGGGAGAGVHPGQATRGW